MHKTDAEKERLFIELGDELFAKYAKCGKISYNVFHWMCRHLITVPYELFVLNSDYTHIFLIERPANDPEWPNMLHSPGTVIRLGDTIETARERLIATEIQCELTPHVFVNVHRFVGMEGNPRNEVSLQYVSVVKGQPKNGRFHSLINLPTNLIPHHIVMGNYLREWLKVNKLPEIK